MEYTLWQAVVIYGAIIVIVLVGFGLFMACVTSGNPTNSDTQRANSYATRKDNPRYWR